MRFLLLFYASKKNGLPQEGFILCLQRSSCRIHNCTYLVIFQIFYDRKQKVLSILGDLSSYLYFPLKPSSPFTRNFKPEGFFSEKSWVLGDANTDPYNLELHYFLFMKPES